MDKAILYYTDNRLDPLIMQAVQRRLEQVELPIVSVSLAPLAFGKNIVLPLQRGYLTMFKQILAGLEACQAEVVYFCEHDVLYHPAHFEMYPLREDRYYYNENCWKVEYPSGRALFYYAQQVSGLCANRELLFQHYYKRVRTVEKHGYSRAMGFEPGTHRRPERVDDFEAESWMSSFPNLDLRHGQNLTPSRWDQAQFRNPRFTRGWQTAETIPGWGKVANGGIKDILKNGRFEHSDPGA